MPTLTLTTVPSGEPHGTMTSYRVHDAAGRLVFATRATARLRAHRALVSGCERGVRRQDTSW
jgi:hypothetical protein